MKTIITSILLLNLLFNSTYSQTDSCYLQIDTLYDHEDGEYHEEVFKLKGDDKSDKLSHTLYSYVGDCSTMNYSYGKYLVKDDSLIYYDYSNGYGKSEIQCYGVSKTTYLLEKKQCKINKVSQKLYYYYHLTAANFLYETPKDSVDKSDFKQFISDHEDKKTTFVFGKESDDLIKEVTSVMKKEVESFFLMDKYQYYKPYSRLLARKYNLKL